MPELQQHPTLNAAVAAVRQQYQINPIAPTPQSVQRLPLGTAVVLCGGVDAVISGHSTADYNRYRVSWFNRHFWRVQHRWIERGSLEGFYDRKQTATAA